MTARIEVTTYFLEMRSLPNCPPVPTPPGAEVVDASSLSARDYLDLYRGVGAPWLWYERSDLDEAKLAGLISDPKVSILLLKSKGATAGYAELLRSAGSVQILYFGLLPTFIGAGLGPYFLNRTVRHAFQPVTKRLWVHTCSLDHPRARATYERAGFVEYKRETGWVRIPEQAIQRRDRAAGKP